MEIFKDHAVYYGKVISLHEAACIMARAMGKMYARYSKDEGWTHEDLANSLEINVIDAWVNGEENEDD